MLGPDYFELADYLLAWDARRRDRKCPVSAEPIDALPSTPRSDESSQSPATALADGVGGGDQEVAGSQHGSVAEAWPSCSPADDRSGQRECQDSVVHVPPSS
jgi:hypothetical protein